MADNKFCDKVQILCNDTYKWKLCLWRNWQKIKPTKWLLLFGP